MAGGLGQPHVPGDHRGVHLAGEVPLDLLRHLEGQVGPPVVHRQHHALQLQGGVEPLLRQPDGIQQIAQPLQGVILALDGNQQGVGGAQPIQGQQLQGGGAVDEDKVIALLHLADGVLQPELPAVQANQLHRGPGQGLVGGGHVRPFGGHDGLGQGRAPQNHVIDARGTGLVQAKAGGGVALGVEVAHQHPRPLGGEGGGQIDAGRGFAHAALLIDNGNAFAHRWVPLFSLGAGRAGRDCFTRNASSQSPLSSASGFAESSARSLAPPFPTKPEVGFAGAPRCRKVRVAPLPPSGKAPYAPLPAAGGRVHYILFGSRLQLFHTCPGKISETISSVSVL